MGTHVNGTTELRILVKSDAAATATFAGIVRHTITASDFREACLFMLILEMKLKSYLNNYRRCVRSRCSGGLTCRT